MNHLQKRQHLILIELGYHDLLIFSVCAKTIYKWKRTVLFSVEQKNATEKCSDDISVTHTSTIPQIAHAPVFFFLLDFHFTVELHCQVSSASLPGREISWSDCVTTWRELTWREHVKLHVLARSQAYSEIIRDSRNIWLL